MFCDYAVRAFCTTPTGWPVLSQKPGSPTVISHLHHDHCSVFCICYIPYVLPGALQILFLSPILHMQKLRLKSILICLEPVTRLVSSGGGTPTHRRAYPVPSYSALTPGVKMWVKYTEFSKAAASPNPQDGSNPSTGEWLGCGRKRAKGLPNTLGF